MLRAAPRSLLFHRLPSTPLWSLRFLRRLGGLLPGALALTRTDLSSARRMRLSGRITLAIYNRHGPACRATVRHICGARLDLVGLDALSQPAPFRC